MTTDKDLQTRLLQRVLDWHEAPSNTPRTLDLPWQEAPLFFGLPSDTTDDVSASWEKIYDALTEMVADERVLADLYVNRVRNLKPGYRGTKELLDAKLADLTAERDQLAADRAQMDADRDALALSRDRLEIDRDRLAVARQEIDLKAEQLDFRAEKLTAAQAELAASQTALTAAQAELAATKSELTAAEADMAARQEKFDRDRAESRRELAAIQEAAQEDMQNARQWRLAAVGVVTLALIAAVWFAESQGWIG